MNRIQTQIELNKIVTDINAVLVGKQCEITGQHEFKPLLAGFKPNITQMTIFGSDVIIKSNVYIDIYEKNWKANIIERTISACDYMIDTLKTHVSKLEAL